MDDVAGHIEDHVIRTAGEPYERIMLRGRHNETFGALDRFVEALDAGRAVVWNDFAPELRPKGDDEIHASCGGPWFTDGGDSGRELPAFLRIEKVELQVGMRGGAKSEDAGLRGVHVQIISVRTSDSRRGHEARDLLRTATRRFGRDAADKLEEILAR